MAQEFSYEIVEEIAVLSENQKGWRKELNLVSWNGRPPKFDLRDFIALDRASNSSLVKVMPFPIFS